MINLLPPEEKKELLIEERRKIIMILWFLFFFFLIFLTLIMFLVKTYLGIQVITQKGLLSEVEKESGQTEIKDFKEKISSINQNLTNLKTFYEKKVYFPNILERISQTLPAESYLTNFSATLSGSVERVSLAGFAPTREILFEFKQRLEKEGDFQNVYFPPTNWVKPNDIDFLVNFEMSYEPKK